MKIWGEDKSFEENLSMAKKDLVMESKLMEEDSSQDSSKESC